MAKRRQQGPLSQMLGNMHLNVEAVAMLNRQIADVQTSLAAATPEQLEAVRHFAPAYHRAVLSFSESVGWLEVASRRLAERVKSI